MALSILLTCLLPIIHLFGSTSRTAQKSQNLGLAVSLAHRIAQHLYITPFNEIQNISLPGLPIADGSADSLFNPIENWTTSAVGELSIQASQLPSLYSFLRKYEFRYALLVNNVSFGTGDELKSISIIITWKEGGQDLLYKLQTHVPGF
ncbi:MAG TPA: hypothetical protein PKO06_02850 [Candidatus Ozemobacteraceae bacterium]|nr:hypothetical protein [Candidatus Ozemobacteraceae bacterium]